MALVLIIEFSHFDVNVSVLARCNALVL